MIRRIALVAAFVMAGLGALAIRVVVEGRAALEAGDRAAKTGDKLAAIDAYETAARWYLPLAPHVDDAYARLRTLAASDDPAISLTAWRSIRSAARATRSLWTPHNDDLAAADAAIAKLSAKEPDAGKVGEKDAAPDDEPTRLAWQTTRLARDIRPSIGAAALAGLGILLWLVGVVVLVRRGIDRHGAWIRRPALGSGVVILLGLVVWFVGLYNA